MQKIEFYFDPCCPWCWITSRWLSVVQEQRDMQVTWKPFSLAMKNGELGKDAGSNNYTKAHQAAHRVIRVIEKAASDGAATRGDLYTAFGKSHFVGDSPYADEMISAVLDELGLSDEYLAAADDESIDEILKLHLDDAIAVVGNDVGVPTIIFENESGEKTGFFGPVLTQLPPEEESLKLWDGLAALSTNISFYELKRSRSAGPDVKSTEHLFN